MERIRPSTPARGRSELVVDLHVPRAHAMFRYLEIIPKRILLSLDPAFNADVAMGVCGAGLLRPGCRYLWFSRPRAVTKLTAESRSMDGMCRLRAMRRDIHLVRTSTDAHHTLRKTKRSLLSVHQTSKTLIPLQHDARRGTENPGHTVSGALPRYLHASDQSPQRQLYRSSPTMVSRQ